MGGSKDISQASACKSDPEDADSFGLTDELYHELKHIARQRIRSMRPGATLNCTALVHEAFLKISQGGEPAQLDRNHLMALASLAMRQVIVDAARRKQADKRGGGAIHITLQESSMGEEEAQFDILELDDALSRLASRDPGLEKLVVLRFFAGLSMDEVARICGKSIRTTERDWTRARVYLYRYLRPNEP